MKVLIEILTNINGGNEYLGKSVLLILKQIFFLLIFYPEELNIELYKCKGS